MINDDQHASHENKIPVVKTFFEVNFSVSFHIFYYRKPVYVIGAELCTWKFADFQNSLQKQGVARPFTGMENVSFQLFWNVHFLCV